MVTRLRDFDKKKLNDNVNRWAKEKNRHHLYNKHLDAITFLYQLFDHIKKNCEYIFRGRILDKERDKEEINGVLEELWHEFAILYTKIKDKKSNRIERQDLANLVMVSDRLKKLGIICHYQIANNHCNKLRKMIENHVSNEEILEFCYQYDRIDNFEFFLQRLKRYYHTFKTWVIEKDFVDKYGFPLGRYYHKIINNEVVLNDTERQQFEEMIKFGMLVVREKQTAGKNSSHEDQ